MSVMNVDTWESLFYVRYPSAGRIGSPVDRCRRRHVFIVLLLNHRKHTCSLLSSSWISHAASAVSGSESRRRSMWALTHNGWLRAISAQPVRFDRHRQWTVVTTERTAPLLYEDRPPGRCVSCKRMSDYTLCSRLVSSARPICLKSWVAI